jgi:GNAT superfamily N-acetyltransferase
LTGDNSLFPFLLANECAFDTLFCNVLRKPEYTLYYNAKFSDDPVFNHIVLNESILEEDTPELTSILEDTEMTANDLSVRSTLFVEDFWKNAARVQQVAIASDYRVVEQMNILSKQVEEPVAPLANPQIVLEETTDVYAWNEVFKRSYQIPDTWNEELIIREDVIVKEEKAILVLSRIRQRPVGCLLLKREPTEVLGVYCVGTIPEMRSRGIARSMLRFSEVLAADNGCKILTLQTISSDNITPLYLKMGYKQQYRRNILEKI